MLGMRKSVLHRLFVKNRLGMIGLLIFACFVAVAIAGPLVVKTDPNKVQILYRLRPPGWMEGGLADHVLGTDQVGRDVLARLIYGARVSLGVALASIACSGVLGIAAGLVAGYFGGRVDGLIMRLADIQLAFPGILLALLVMAVLGPGLINIVLVLSLTGWVHFARIVRGAVLSIREQEYVQAAVAMGNTVMRILFVHIFPNVLAPTIVVASLSVGRVIITEATLSFLGIGVPLTVPTWGSMLAEGREFLDSAWWVVTFPGLAMVLVVLAANVMGDGLRDVLDPKLEQ